LVRLSRKSFATVESVNNFVSNKSGSSIVEVESVWFMINRTSWDEANRLNVANTITSNMCLKRTMLN